VPFRKKQDGRNLRGGLRPAVYLVDFPELSVGPVREIEGVMKVVKASS